MALPELEDLRLFLIVVDHGSIAAAARADGIPKPSLSRRMANLETAVGEKLFDRGANRLSLTPRGDELNARLRPAMQNVAQALSELDDWHSDYTGHLSMHVPASLLQMGVRQTISSFLEAHPMTRFDLTLSNRPVERLDTDTHLALVIGGLPDSDLIAARVGQTRRILVASPEYIDTHCEITHPDQLSDHVVIAPGPHIPLSLKHEDSKNWTQSFEPQFAIDDVRDVTHEAIAGRGVAISTALAAAGELAKGRLIQLLHDWQEQPMPISILYRDNRLQSRLERDFVKVLRAELNRSLTDHL
ncbi:LysR family transcriptional regulator [Ruegeria sp. HKCCD6157]|uniref:LysR family transcriptional regulator n=1 Tax=Ruegeria sp. HKCCD6157 TaxID=2690707 RepID=UPI0014910727|nr:LysR family transcriptional regulator [Ruegeria sp. HKCCD6157]NOE28512.1 LysR family transcriptional regulator [Ruegeria sp. HKCCD6157]